MDSGAESSSSAALAVAAAASLSDSMFAAAPEESAAPERERSRRKATRRQNSSSASENMDDDAYPKRLPTLPSIYQPKTTKTSDFYNNFIAKSESKADDEKAHSLVVDFLICEGYREAAELLCTESNRDFPDEEKDCLHKRYEIRTSIVRGEIAKAIEQINAYVPNLLVVHPKVHFQLLRQQLVELIRENQVEAALNFAKQHLVHIANQPPELLQKLEQTYGLLVFDKPDESPFGFLMDMSQRNILAAEVNSLICGLNDRNPTSKLEQLFRLIVWNKHQIESRGEAISTPDAVQAAQIARAMFCPEDALYKGIANF